MIRRFLSRSLALGLVVAAASGGGEARAQTSRTVSWFDGDFTGWQPVAYGAPNGTTTELRAVRVPDGGNTGSTPDPFMDVTDILGTPVPSDATGEWWSPSHQPNLQGILRNPGATWNPAVDGPITKLTFHVDVRMIQRTLYSVEGTGNHAGGTGSFPGSFVRSDGEVVNGFSVQAYVEQNGHRYTERLALACPGGATAECFAWHTVGGSFGEGGTRPLSSLHEPFDDTAPASPDFSVNGAPMTFGVVLAISGGAPAFTGAYEGAVDNWRLDVESPITNHPPELTVPGGIVASPTSGAGAAVTYAVSASDPDGDAVTVSCTPPSGSTFALGTTTVTCTATDSHGASTTASFTVSVNFDACWASEGAGFRQPIDPTGPRSFRIGSTIPAKLALGACSAITDIRPRLYLSRGGASQDATSTSAADTANVMRLGGGGFIYNLATRGLAAGTWLLSADLGDGILRSTPLDLR